MSNFIFHELNSHEKSNRFIVYAYANYGIC